MENNAIPSTSEDTFKKMLSSMNFMGIVTIIIGALSCLSIFGAIVGIPLIIAGIRLKDSVDNYKRYQNSGDSNELMSAFEKQGSYFYIYKIIMIVYFVLIALSFIGLIIFSIFMGGSMQQELMRGMHQ